ncbi:MAG: hypothetical protein KAH10_05175 [Flavobacteriales bacterium]|nr:hypothetical protein [Flavobacteriales bacterium]
MKKITLVAALFLMAISFNVDAQSKLGFKLDFKNTSLGKLTSEKLIKESDSLKWDLLSDNTEIVNDKERGKVLKVKYPKGNVGPNSIGASGSQFLKELTPANEYYLDYYVKFDKGFDFAKGGKLPGLTSGGDKYTGGNHPHNGEGWSTRYMWVDKGGLILYFYFIDMAHKYGDVIQTNIQFETGKWYRLTQRVKINKTDSKDGILQVWVDGKEVINKQNVRFRIGEQGMIDTFYFSTFHGGATSDWAPQNDSYSRFDKFVISTEKPDFLK